MNDLTRHRHILASHPLYKHIPVVNPLINSGTIPQLSPQVWITSSIHSAMELTALGVGWTLLPMCSVSYGSRSDLLTVLELDDISFPPAEVVQLQRLGAETNGAMLCFYNDIAKIIEEKVWCLSGD